MALNSSKYGGVVSRSGRVGAVVRGSRHVGGRVIGEVLFGGRNVSGVAIKTRSKPRPTKDSVRHSLRPAPKAAGDDYSDFGFEDGWETLREETPAARRDGLVRQRQDEFNIFTYVMQAFGVAAGGLTRLFFIGVAYYVFSEEIAREFPFLKIVLIPMLLAVWCGAGMGASAKRRLHAGRIAAPAALAGAVVGALVVGAGFYSVARYIGFYPTFVLADFFGLPRETYDYLRILDQGISQLFMMFDKATYAVVPLFGAALGWVFGKR